MSPSSKTFGRAIAYDDTGGRIGKKLSVSRSQALIDGTKESPLRAKVYKMFQLG